MPHRDSQDRFFRARHIALLAGVIAVSVAARSQTGATAPAQQPTPAATPAVPAADPQALQDTLRTVDSFAGASATVGAIDSASALQTPTYAARSMAVAAAPAAWPVDPVTGQTLINGIPVVGKVFIMQKTDGVVKVETVAQELQNEALPPAAAIVGSSATGYTGPVRRQRTVMTQATLWGNDNKAKAVSHRYIAPTTSGASLGQP
jgi:hypothetical protein